MSDEIVTETVGNVGAETPAPSINQAKPYDDDLLEAYEKEALEENTSEDTKVFEQTKVENTKVEEETKIEPQKIEENLEDTSIKRTINGKEVEFTVKDAINSHIKIEEFNRNMDRRVQDVTKKEQEVLRKQQEWNSEEETFKSRLIDVIKGAQTGNFIDSIRLLAKLAAGRSDLDIVKFEKMYFDQLENVREVYSKMTPEQREAYFAKREANEAKAEAERLKGEKASSQAQSQLQAQVDSAIAKFNLTHEEFWGNYKTLTETQVGENKPFKHPNDITVADVTQHSLLVKHWEKIYTAGERLGISDEAILDEVGQITKTYPDLTVEDVIKVINNAGIADSSVVENLNRKAGKNKQLNSSVSSTKKANGKIEGLEAEDLDFLYRNQPKAYTRIVR